MTSLLDLPDGIHLDVPSAVYHERIPGIISRSALAKFEKAARVYEAWMAGAPDESTPPLEFGQAFHCALLEPEVFADAYVVEPAFGDMRYKESKARRDAWLEANGAKKRVSADDYTRMQGMASSIRAHRLASLLTDGKSEVTGLWTDPGTGLRCKLRADYWIEAQRTIVDVKTTEDASSAGFERSVARYGYHVQRVFYGDGLHAASGLDVENFIFLAVEKTPPYLCAMYALDADGVSRARAKVRRLMDRMAECIGSGVFPGYPETIQTISLPAWAP